MITEGRVNKKELHFSINRIETSSWETHEVVHHYFGELEDDQIQFTLQIEGSGLPHDPIEFTAQKVSDINN